MEIKRLDKKTFSGRKFTTCYKTNGYYDIHETDSGFQMNHVPFGSTVDKSFEDEFFGSWLEDPIAFGAFDEEELVEFVEGSIESWNNRFRISNICIFNNAKRGTGIGTALMDAMQWEALASGARMIVLETQSCNENAIAFYRRNGFSIIGFDLYSYSNTDPQQHEVRIEMGKKLK